MKWVMLLISHAVVCNLNVSCFKMILKNINRVNLTIFKSNKFGELRSLRRNSWHPGRILYILIL